MAEWDRDASFHRAKTQEAKLLLSRQVLNATLQPGKDPATVTARAWKYVLRLMRWGSFSTKSSSGSISWTTSLYKGSHSRYNVQYGSGKGRTISDTALFAAGSKAEKGGGCDGGRGSNNKSKAESKGRGEGCMKGNPSPKGEMT